MAAVLLSFALPALAAYLAVRWAWPGTGPWTVLLRASLAIGLAVGTSSVVFFAWVVCVGPRVPGLPVAEAVLFGAIAVFFWWRAAGFTPAVFRRDKPAGSPVTLRLAFGFVLVCAAGAAVCSFARTPHGDWDTWGIWNLRARFLYRGGEHWTNAFSPLIPWTHPDYPLLVPGAVARGWTYAGGETPLVPQLIATLFGAATGGLLTAALALLRGPSQGYLGGLALLATPFFVELTTAQYADVPLGFYFLAVAALFEAHDRRGRQGVRLPFLAGLLAGLATWTKNEGQLFLIATLAARALPALRRRGAVRGAIGELAAFAIGLSPMLAVLAYFKLRLAPVNDLVAGQGMEQTPGRLLDGWRYLTVAAWFTQALLKIGPGAVVVLAVYFRLLGRARLRPSHTFTVLVLMVAGYAVVYLTTPQKLDIHLGTSVDRLFLQLWPLGLLAFFLATATPEEAQARPS
jgi:hypothetical protein